MSGEDRGARARAPAGYYSDLSKGAVGAKMAETGLEEKKLKGKKKNSKVASKASSKKSLQLEDELDQRSQELGQELEQLEQKDSMSKYLHAEAMKGRVEFIEDMDAPEELEKDEIWQKATGDHSQEQNTIMVRMQRLERKKELMEIKHEIRQRRLVLMQQEKALELQEKQRQIELGAAWLQMQKDEQAVEARWNKQRREMEDFENTKRVKGWVAEATARVSRGEVGSVHSKACSETMRLGKAKGQAGGEGGTARKKDKEKERVTRMEPGIQRGKLTGIPHLERMGLMPAYGLSDRDLIRQLPAQDTMSVRQPENRGFEPEGWDQLSVKGDIGKPTHNNPGNGGAGDVKADKVKIKSGKFAKSHQELVREESWPHLSVLRQYARRTTFDQMEYDAFVAGETRIIGALFKKDMGRAMGRLNVLCRISHWLCKCKDWHAVRTIYESIIESIEMGDADWTSCFDSHESLLPPAPSVLAAFKKAQEEKSAKDQEKKKDNEMKKSAEVFWCKDYQKGTCTEAGPHMAQLKPDEKPVWVVHICATCWQKDKVKKNHHEGDSGCPHKKN